MELKEGTYVSSKIEKTFAHGAYEDITLPKGVKGTICEVVKYNNQTYYLIELDDDRFRDPTLGVFDYNEDEVEVVKE